MIEIPESTIISRQAAEILPGKIIVYVMYGNSPHRFTFYNGDPEDYPALLEGRRVETVNAYGAFVDVVMDKDTHLVIGDGTNMRYYQAGEDYPPKYQQILILEDGSFLSFSVSMYGCIYAFQGEFDNPYYQGSIRKPSPLDDSFDEAYFSALVAGTKQNLTIKALLATEQRIPGLGNGVMQDILFNVGIHPKRRISTLSTLEQNDLLYSIKGTLTEMIERGGRDTERDFLGNLGGYRTILSRNTYKNPCPHCGHPIVRESHLGGTIYYCPACQKLVE